MNHIQIITHLTKNAPNHTRITAPFFLIAGLCITITAITSSLLLNWHIKLEGATPTKPFQFPLISWIATIIIPIIALLLATRKQQKKQNTPLLSPSLKHITSSILPPMVIAFVLSWTIATNYPRTSAPFNASLLIIFYALTLTSIKAYLPKSARILSNILLALGTTTWIINWQLTLLEINPTHLANFYLILTGLLHIITATGSLLFEKPHPSSPNLTI